MNVWFRLQAFYHQWNCWVSVQFTTLHFREMNRQWEVLSRSVTDGDIHFNGQNLDDDLKLMVFTMVNVNDHVVSMIR